MRLFIGFKLPTKIKDELFRIQKKLTSKGAKIKWVSKKNLHLTFKFLGEVDNKKLKKLMTKLNTIQFNPINLELSNLNNFQNNNRKILWVGIRPKEGVIKLQQKIDYELLSLFNFDQNFQPHLTIGRIKSFKKINEFISVLGKIKIDNLKFEVFSFSLFESKLNHNGSTYEKIYEFNAKHL